MASAGWNPGRPGGEDGAKRRPGSTRFGSFVWWLVVGFECFWCVCRGFGGSCFLKLADTIEAYFLER